MQAVFLIILIEIAFRRGDTLIVGRRALDRDDKHMYATSHVADPMLLLMIKVAFRLMIPLSQKINSESTLSYTKKRRRMREKGQRRRRYS